MMNKLDKLDEYFLGKDHPFRLPPDVVSTLTASKRRELFSQFQDSWKE